MKPKMMLKMGIDLVMTVLLLCQMAYILVGETVHEYLGTAMFVLFILHHLLNRNWYRSLKKGRYGAVRILQTAVNTLVLLCMLGLMVSGVILSREGPGPYITHVTTGKIVDKGIQDANNMGAAMAPAAYDTIQAHFRDTGRRPSDYDLIVTGDLGSLGKEILLDLFHRDGIEFKNLEDCGVLIYDAQTQDVHCGGSGCGCSAAVLTGFLLNGMKQGRWRRLLFCGTGALLSPTSTLQGESIPSICHAVAISTEQ